LNESERSGRWSFLTRPGPWFWVLVAAGLSARIFLAVATHGTEDARLWTAHASGVAEHGLIRHYAREAQFNHPPAIAWAMARLWELSSSLGLEFRVAYRLPVALVDLLSAFLIVRVLRDSRWRWVAAGLYCIAPVACVLAAQHGNTDALIAACLLGCTLFAAERRPIATGALLGLCAWIKLPGLIAAPALVFVFPRWRDRALCSAVALAVASSTYVGPLIEAARFAASHPRAVPSGGNVVWERVFLYRGYFLQIDGEPPIWVWGLKNFLLRALGDDVRAWPTWAVWWCWNNSKIALPLIVVYGFLRRREHTALGIAATIAGTYAIFYALIEAWAFQYFAWSMPFWMLAGWRYATLSNVFGGGYIYAFYAFASGDWLLRPEWRPLTVADWPVELVWLRDAAVVTFLAFAATWFAKAVATEFAAWRARRARVTSAGS